MDVEGIWISRFYLPRQIAGIMYEYVRVEYEHNTYSAHLLPRDNFRRISKSFSKYGDRQTGDGQVAENVK